MAVYKAKKPTKDGRTYYFRIKYKNIFGEIIDYNSPKFKNKKDAESEEARYRIKISENSTFTSTIKIKQAYLELLSLKRQENKKQTIEKIETHYKYIKPLENININDINVMTYKKLRNYIESFNYSADYSNKIQGLFKQIIEYSNKYYNTSNTIIKYITPFKDVNKIKKEFDIFSYEEYKKFDSVIDKFEYHCFFEILYMVGLRCGECMALTWNDINFKKGNISINKTLTTKIKGQNYTISSPKTKNSIRILPIPKKVLEDLKIMQNNAMQFTDYSNNWFVFGNSLPFAESSIASAKNKYCKLANVKQIRIHDFRHSFASMLISMGASISLISKYMGHSSVSITLDVYSHLVPNELDNIMLKMNELK